MDCKHKDCEMRQPECINKECYMGSETIDIRGEGMKTPEEIRFFAEFRTSRLEYVSDPKRFEIISNAKIYKLLADHIVQEKAKLTLDDFSAEKRLDVYVATPEVFWEIVQREAEKIAQRFITAR